MVVGMMHVGDMRVATAKSLVSVSMRMRLSRRIAGAMLVPVVLVVDVNMLVLNWLVNMLVLVMLREVQPDADAH